MKILHRERYLRHSQWIYTRMAYCGFKWTNEIGADVEWPTFPAPFSEEPTCLICEQVYVIEVLGDLP